MLNTRFLVACALAIGAITSASVADASDEKDAYLGTWELNLEESIAPPGRPFRPFRVTVYESGEFLDFTQISTNAAGEPTEFSHRTRIDGVERELPGMPGARAAFTRLPSGVVDAKLRFPDGSLQNKICVMQPSMRQQMCLATITSPLGHTVFFKHVLDKVD